MRVLHLVAFPTMTGPADPALGLARAQRKAGLTVTIAIDRRRSGDMKEKVRAADVPLLDGLTLSTKGSLFEQLGDARALKSLSAGFDIVHAHASHEHALAAFRHAGRCLVRSIHHPRGARRRGLQGVIYRRTDGFLLPAEAHRKILLESYPIDRDRTLVVPGAIDPQRFFPEVDGVAIRRAESIRDDVFVFGMIARIKPGRGHERLLDAFEIVRADARRPIHLVFIGKGEGEPDLDASIARRGLGEVIHRYGFRDADLPQAIASCDVTVLLEEGNDAGCRAVLESMAVGVPVIGAAHPAIAEAIDDDVGWLVPIGDTNTLVAAMHSATQADLSEKRRACGTRVADRFTDVRRADRVSAFYEVLLSRPS